MDRAGSTACAIATALALFAIAPAARADEVEAARQAYDRGAAAYDAGEYARAVAELSRADELAPNDVALDLALKAATKADDAIALVSLADRADKRGVLGAAAQAARAKGAGRTGKITTGCADAGSCRASIDGVPVRPGETNVVLIGHHRVVVEDMNGREQRDLEIAPDAASSFIKKPRVVATTTPGATPDPTPATAPSESSGISPAWFWTGVGLTAVLGGVSVISALDTKEKHDQFESTPTGSLRRQGLDAQLRTNLLAGGTLVAAVATTVVALVFVDWKGTKSPTTTGRTR